MLRWPRLFLIACCAATALHGARSAEDVPAYKLGLDALGGRLWEVAAARFQTALEAEDLAPEARQTILLRLAEARIRGGQAESAMEVLADPALDEHPARPFWHAQALVAGGRFHEAVDAFASLPEDTPYREEARLTRAHLQRAIGDLAGALSTLDSFLEIEPDAARARLLKAEILLSREDPEGALEALPEITNLPPDQAEVARRLRGRCLLALGRANAAAAQFADLVDSPEHQTLVDHHRNIIHLARARLALGETGAAADGLLAFIQQEPESPVLIDAFGALLDCLPDEPAPNDPILTRLREWVPEPRLDGPALPTLPGGAVGAWPEPTARAVPLAPEAMFHLALGLRREGDLPGAEESARRLFTRLRMEYPAHPLVPRSLLEAGRWALEDGDLARASAHFEAVNRLGDDAPAELRAQALSLEGAARFREQAFDEAAAHFDQAADLLAADRRHTARLNAANALLSAGDLAGLDRLSRKADTAELQAELALERALHLAAGREAEALPALLGFIRSHPLHPRLPEARLSAALAALDAIPPDIDEAAHQLELMNEGDARGLPPDSLALAEIRLHERRGEWTAAAERAAAFLENHPRSPARVTVLFEQGKALFRNKDYNDARLVLESLAQEAPASPQTPAALLLSARAAAEGATPQSQQESLALFDRLIAMDSGFEAVARLEKADLLIRLARLDEAVGILGPWFDDMEADHPLLLSVGLLLGDALFAQAENDTAVLERALAVYDRLLAILPPDSPVRHRVLYQKGLTFERFGDREDDALIAYMDVVQSASGSPRGDWKSIELCGFSALRILERRGEWRAAKHLAEDIAALGGPRAEEAAERAKTLGLEHYIWDE